MSLSRAGPVAVKPDQPLPVLGDPGRLGLPEDVAPAFDPLGHLLAAVVEDALRHQPGVGVVPDVDVQSR